MTKNLGNLNYDEDLDIPLKLLKASSENSKQAAKYIMKADKIEKLNAQMLLVLEVALREMIYAGWHKTSSIAARKDTVKIILEAIDKSREGV